MSTRHGRQETLSFLPSLHSVLLRRPRLNSRHNKIRNPTAHVQVFKFSFYVIFFAVMFTLYGVPPLNLIRDIYMSFDQLQRRLQAFYRYAHVRICAGFKCVLQRAGLL